MYITKQNQRKTFFLICVLLMLIFVGVYFFAKERKTQDESLSSTPEQYMGTCSAYTEDECLTSSSCRPHYEQTSGTSRFTQCIETPINEEEYSIIESRCNLNSGTLVSYDDDLQCICKTDSGEEKDCLKDLIEELRTNSAS